MRTAYSKYRLLKWAGFGLAGVIGFVLTLVLVTLAVLSTPWGSERLRRLAVSRVNAALAGSLEVDRLQFRVTRVVLHGVRLRDPDGETVADVESLEAAVSPLALLHKTIDVRLVRIGSPRLALRQDEEGLNLARAIKPKAPAAPPAPEASQKSSLSLVVRQFEIDDGSIDFLRALESAAQEFVVDALYVSCSLAIRNGGTELLSDLKIRGQLQEPLEGPFQLTASAHGHGENRAASLEVAIANSKLKAHATSSSPENAQLTIENLWLTPQLARGFIPTYPLRIPLRLRGELTKQQSDLAAKLRADAGSSVLLADASGAIGPAKRGKIYLQLRDADMAQLVHGPQSRIEVAIHASARGNSMEDLDANIQLEMPESRVDGRTVGPVHLTAEARKSELQIAELIARAPGVSVRGSGRGNVERLEASLQVDARDIDLLAKTFARDAKTPIVGGTAQVRLGIHGRLKHPSVDLTMRAPRLRWQTNQVRDLNLSAFVPDATVPLRSRVNIFASQADLGRRSLKNLRFVLASEQSAFSLDAETHGFAELRVHADGALDQDAKGLLLSHFGVRYPEAEWTLASPSRIAFRGDEIVVGKLALRSAAQSILLDGRKGQGHVAAFLDLEHFDLGLLPKAFIDPSWKLAGLVSARIRANGTLSRPAVAARIDVQNAHYKSLSKLFALADATYAQDRARGTLKANSDGIEVDLAFDAPVQGLLKGRHEPVRVNGEIREVNLETLAQNLGIRFPLGGRVGARVAVSGMADDPKLDARITGKQIRYRQTPAFDAALKVQSLQVNKLATRAEFELDGNQSFLEVKIPYALGRLIRRPPRARELMRTPLEVTGNVRSFPLPFLFKAGLTQDEIGGLLTMKAKMVGSATMPVGDLHVEIAGASMGDIPPADVNFALTSRTSGARAKLAVSQQRQSILNLTAAVGGSGTRAVRNFATIPLEVKATAGPIAVKDIQALLATPNELEATPPTLNGTLAAELSASGTLTSPECKFHLHLDSLGPHPQKAAKVDVNYDYKRALNKLTVLVAAADQSRLQATAESRLDLSYPAFSRGLSVADASLKANLQAQALDLSFLTGLSPMIRHMGGRLGAAANVAGSIGHPQVQGQMEWQQGLVALVGYGEFKDIHLQLVGDGQHIELKELTVHSGKGEGKIYALAQTAAPNRFTLRSTINLSRFPIMTEDQLVANLSLKSSIDGTLGPHGLNLKQVSIPEAHVELPDVAHKNAEKLSPPQNVVFVRNGKRLRDGKKGQSSPAGPPSTASAFHLRALVNAPRNLWVKGKDINAEFGLSDGFRVESSDTVAIFGDVTVIRGRLDVMGKRFDFLRSGKVSKITFAGAAMNPNLDVTAEYKNEAEQVIVYLNVTGEGTHVTISPTSDPPLTETEIYTLLATGHRSLRPGSGKTSPGGEAASIVGSLAASELKSTLGSKLPLDVLSIEAGDQGLSGTKVEVGTYVSDKLYLGFGGRIGADPLKHENANEVRFEYQLTRRWEVDATYGDARAGGADFVWSKSY